MDAELSQRLTHLLDRLDHWLPPAAEPVNWQTEVAALWQRHPLGGRLVAVPPRDALALDDLLGIERQKQALVDNTRAFLQGLPANHALLWGARGSGKSSVVRALLNALAGEGLRLVQIDRHELASLPVLVEQLRHQPQRFVVYCDDLSFEGNDDAYKALKSVLDGALTGPPDDPYPPQGEPGKKVWACWVMMPPRSMMGRPSFVMETMGVESMTRPV